MGLDAVPAHKKEKGDLRAKSDGNGKDFTPMSHVFHSGQSQLLETSREYWSDPSTTQNDRKAYIDGLKASYQSLLDEFIASADACVDYTNSLENLNKRWRWTVILATGVVAIINILAANLVTGNHTTNVETGIQIADIAAVFSVTAAVAAAILAVLANLENFAGAQRRAQGFRQARERFLDASREYEQLWNTYVNPFYPRAEACLNSIILIRMLVEKDRELRDRLVELTKAKGQET